MRTGDILVADGTGVLVFLEELENVISNVEKFSADDNQAMLSLRKV